MLSAMTSLLGFQVSLCLSQSVKSLNPVRKRKVSPLRLYGR